MTRVVDIDVTYKMDAKKAIKKFFKGHPELDYWKEQFEWMNETNTDHFDDRRMADGTINNEWCYSLWLDKIDDNITYIAVIERN